MRDKFKSSKYSSIDKEDANFRFYMCRKCKFYEEEKCTKKRIPRICARKGLKNKE